MKNFLIAALAAWTLAAGAAEPRTVEMTVDGLVCAFCAQGIDKKLRQLDATQDVYVSLEKHLVALSLKDAKDVSDETLRAALTDAGYTVRDIRRTATALDALRKP